MEEQTLVILALQMVEEPHETLFSHQAKLFQMRDGKWEERGFGDAKLHVHRKTGKTCFMMRKESTMEVIAKFYVLNVPEYCELTSNAANDSTWVWMAPASQELVLQFKDAVELAKLFLRSTDHG